MNADLVIDDLHPLLERLVQQTDAARLDGDALDAWASQPGAAMLVFAKSPTATRKRWTSRSSCPSCTPHGPAPSASAC
jgi:hypothetical protein